MIAASGKTGGEYRRTTLRNGLRVITERLPSVRSISLGVWVDTGGRNERDDEGGISHLIEHMVFKGTKQRSAKDIASALESIGGNLNAFTSREQTCFTARVLDEHLELAVDILADITCRATFTPINLKREKLVILEEIKESLENPSDHVHDLFAGAFWGDHPLGRPILGPADTVRSISRGRIRKYLDGHYRSKSIVIAASGSVSHAKLVRLVRDSFSFAGGEAIEGTPAELGGGPRFAVESNDNQQIHACLGYPGFRYRDKHRLPFMILVTHLGGGMSSVLFQKVREQKGLAYTIFSYHDPYRDAGLFATYFATDKGRLGQALQITLRELRRVTRTPIPSERLEQVKQQLKGQLVIGMESTAARMNRLARLELMLGRHISLEQTMREIDQVTVGQIQELARMAFDENQLTIAALGPTDQRVLEDAI